MTFSPRLSRYTLLASAIGLGALTGAMLLPAVASAQPSVTADAPTITLVLSPATVDYGHQSVTAAGTVSTSFGPVAGATVTVSYMDVDQQDAQISMTTGSAGGYSATLPDPERAPQTVTASVAATSSTTAASASAQLDFTIDAVTITASFAKPSVNAGSTDMLSGVASYVSGGSPHPLANSPLSIDFAESGQLAYSYSATVATAADGSFSYLPPAINLATQNAAATISSAATPYLDAGQVSISVPVNQLVQLSYFAGHLNAHHVLRLSVCGGIPQPLANAALIGPLYFRYATSRYGPWKPLGVGNGPGYHYGPCVGDGGTYKGKFTAPLANGYYRAYAPAVPGQMSALSRVIHLQRYRTRITGFAITPRRVRHDGKVTVSGRLWQLKTRWLPSRGATISIEYRYQNKTYTLKQRLKTNSAGQFRGVFAVPHSAVWLAVYGGGQGRFATSSTSVRITVR